ncbi:MAG TPA: hypothetical protein PKA90_16675 [Ignavibacteria bacterium]|nr:hypothetical protein [Ignavibacteria bacterium]HMR42052.1 hypothetical protein [Ignavibacteria bacterium]
MKLISGLKEFLSGSKMNRRILGEWHSDLNDLFTREEIGDVAIIFYDNGQLIYKIKNENKTQVIEMTYKLISNEIISNQPSHPQMEKTIIDSLSDDVLILNYNGRRTRFFRLQYNH